MGNTLSVEQATQTLFERLSEAAGWKLLKSQRCLKKQVGELVFEIDFYTSKWNSSNEYVGVNAGFSVWNKSYDKKLSVNSVILSTMLTPRDEYWFDITTQEKLDNVYNELNEMINQTAVSLADAFEKDRESAVKRLVDEHFFDYNVYIDYAAQVLGKKAVMQIVQQIYDSLTDKVRQQIPDYLSGAKNAQWMLNRSNLRYIIDNKLVDMQM